MLIEPKRRCERAVVPSALLVAAALCLVLPAAPGCEQAQHNRKGQVVAAREGEPRTSGTRDGDAGKSDPGLSDAGRSGLAVAPAQTPAVSIDVGGKPVMFHVQVAMTAEERANGLVGRPTLASDAGLLLVFEETGIHALDMAKTLIPVDMIFIGSDRRIAGIVQRAKPLTSTKRRIAAPSRYVLQVAAGLSSRHGFRVGQSVELRAVPGN